SLKLGLCFAAVNRFCGEAHAVCEVAYTAASDERRCGVQQNDVAARAAHAVQDLQNHPAVLPGIAAANRFERRPPESEIFRRYGVRPQFAIGKFGYFARGADADFVKAVAAVNDEGALRAERPQ